MSVDPGSEPAGGLARYLARARATHDYTARHLAYYAGGTGCADARWVSYRRSTAEPAFSDSWYDFSQLQADAALLARGDTTAQCYVEKAFLHLERHWDPREPGGYFGRGAVDGSRVDGPDKYADDNALAGIALLEAHASAPDAAARARYLARAIAIGKYLTRGPLWDDVFDGGFWWNSRRGDSVEGKPAQSNALAALLFLRLHALTADAHWRTWAARTLAWLDAALWDAAANLTCYSVRYADPARRRGRALERRYFNYDQAILLEALVWDARLTEAAAAGGVAASPAPALAGAVSLPGSPALARARAIAAALEPRFWDASLGGFVLEAGVPQVLLVYAAWLTPALLTLAAADGDPRWVALARRNVDALHARLYDPADGGYAHRAWRDGDRVRVDPERHTAAQGWMQYAQARLALAP
jgi:uncharacterized protein YyaL (SSP411 family)